MSFLLFFWTLKVQEIVAKIQVCKNKNTALERGLPHWAPVRALIIHEVEKKSYLCDDLSFVCCLN
jgi:hypothetical protein